MSLISPQTFTLDRKDGIADRLLPPAPQPVRYRLSVAVERDDPDLDDLVILARAA